MIMRKILYLFMAGAMLFAVSACGSYAKYYNEPVNVPAQYGNEQVNRRGNPGAARRGPVTRTVVPANPHRPPGSVAAPPQPGRVIPHSAAHPQGRVIQVPDLQDGYYQPGPQAMQAIPPEPTLQVDSNVQVNPPAHSSGQRPVQADSTPTPGESAASAYSAANRRELASHKTEFDAKDEGRANNITRASGSINGKVVQPGETFSYNETVGPTIERRGYKEGVIFVEGEKKKGFGGGVCQVSTTLSIAADNAGMTIIERHDHSLPVSYAKEGEEAATSYGGLDFKFKNEKSFPVVINSSVEGGTITVCICEG